MQNKQNQALWPIEQKKILWTSKWGVIYKTESEELWLGGVKCSRQNEFWGDGGYIRIFENRGQQLPSNNALNFLTNEILINCTGYFSKMELQAHWVRVDKAKCNTTAGHRCC